MSEGINVLISGSYNAFNDGFNGAGVYLASGLFQSQTFERPIYIGSAVDLRDRIVLQHLNALQKPVWIEEKTKTNKPLFCAWKKHGSESFVWFLLEVCPPESVLEREQYYLDKERPFCDEMRGYNIAHNAQSPTLGKKLSDETKAKISKASIGNKSRLGKKHSEQTKCLIARAAKGQHAKPFVLIAPNGEVIKENNLLEFCRVNGLSQGNLVNVLAGKRKSHKGYRQYKEAI